VEPNDERFLFSSSNFLTILFPLSQEMINETFLQLTKQINNNPSTLLLSRIFSIFLLLSSLFPISEVFLYPVLSILKKNLEKEKVLEKINRACFVRLAKGKGRERRKVKPELEEICSIQMMKKVDKNKIFIIFAQSLLFFRTTF
jgi:MyTH4 domain